MRKVRVLRFLLCFIEAMAWSHHGFYGSTIPTEFAMNKRHGISKICSHVMTMKGVDSDGDDSSNRHRQNKGRLFGRIGGRKKRHSTNMGKVKNQRDSSSVIPFWGVALGVAVLLSSLFGWNQGSDPSFVYYESSFYESRDYSSDGKVESYRKESFKSNVPGLVQELKQRQGEVSLESTSSALNEIDLAQRIQAAILDDFF